MRWAARTQRHQTIRQLVACVQPAVESLRSGLRLLDNVDSVERLRAYFSVVPHAVDSEILAELSEKVRGNLPFDQGTLASWREAESAAKTCQKLFDQLQDQSVLPRQGNNAIGQIPALKDRFRAAEANVVTVLRRMATDAPTDALQTIRRLTGDA